MNALLACLLHWHKPVTTDRGPTKGLPAAGSIQSSEALWKRVVGLGNSGGLPRGEGRIAKNPEPRWRRNDSRLCLTHWRGLLDAARHLIYISFNFFRLFATAGEIQRSSWTTQCSFDLFPGEAVWCGHPPLPQKSRTINSQLYLAKAPLLVSALTHSYNQKC